MMMRILHPRRGFLAAAALLVGCAGTNDAGRSTDPGAEAAIARTVEERVLAYPDAHLSDFKENTGGTAACALLRSEKGPPHVVLSTKGADGWVVSTPYLFEPDSWSRDPNVEGSQARRSICANYQIALPAA